MLPRDHPTGGGPTGKAEIRDRVWKRLEKARVARFPWPVRGRIPNFEGAKTAAERLADLDVWEDARAIKTNPDSPQRWARSHALSGGKVLYMAVPRLTKLEAFLELDPGHMAAPEKAATIKGAFALGKPVRLERIPPLDLILAGSVAVDKHGGRLGKGGGYSDLEYALGRTFGFVAETTPILTTVHPLQLVREPIPMREHDIPVDFAAFPDRIASTHTAHPRPKGIQWNLLPEEKIQAIPVLQNLVERGLDPGGT